MTADGSPPGAAAARSPADLERFVADQGIRARIVAPGVPTPTVADAAAALGVAPEAILKSLVFLVDGAPHLVVAAGTDRLRYPLLADALVTSRRKIRLAEPEEALAITGFPVGAMPPFGHRTPLPTLVDAAGVARGRVVYGGGGARDALLELSTDDLLAVTGATYVALTAREDTAAPAGGAA